MSWTMLGNRSEPGMQKKAEIAWIKMIKGGSMLKVVIIVEQRDACASVSVNVEAKVAWRRIDW
jgi:hypothetical protein